MAVEPGPDQEGGVDKGRSKGEDSRGEGKGGGQRSDDYCKLDSATALTKGVLNCEVGRRRRGPSSVLIMNYRRQKISHIKDYEEKKDRNSSLEEANRPATVGRHHGGGRIIQGLFLGQLQKD